ncbi:hypothetical protein SprV_0301174200 [Sparganum proliferum]
MPMLPADVPDTIRPCRTSSCQLQHPDYTNPLSSSQTPPRHPRRQLTLTTLLSHYFLLPLLLVHRLKVCCSGSCSHHPCTQSGHTNKHQPPPPQPTTLAMLTRSIRVLVATSNSPHTSAWSVTCESISQRLASQCLEHQPTLTSTVHTAPRTCTHYMGLFGHVRIRESGIDPSLDTSSNSCTSTMSSSTQTLPSSMTTISSSTTATIPETDTPDLPCPQCPRTFTSHIGLVSHLQIHRAETGEPVPAAPTYTHRTRLHCPHCPRTFTHRMGIVGHMRIHEHLRWALLSGHIPGNRLDRRAKPGEGGYSRCALCRVHRVLRTPLDGWPDGTRRRHRRDEAPSDNPRSNRPELRTALVGRELARYKVDIAPLSETRFSEQGQLEEMGAGYTLFWSGRPKAERRDAGVAFAIRNDIVGRLPVCRRASTIA